MTYIFEDETMNSDNNKIEDESECNFFYSN